MVLLAATNCCVPVGSRVPDLHSEQKPLCCVSSVGCADKALHLPQEYFTKHTDNTKGTLKSVTKVLKSIKIYIFLV